MKVRSRFVALLAILTLSVLPLFAGTRMVYRWVLTGIPMPTIRKYFEDKMEELLAKSGVTGIKSHMVFSSQE